MKILWRHLFQTGTDVNSLFYIFGMPVEVYLVIFSFVCVSVFLFLSRFGLGEGFSDHLTADFRMVSGLAAFFGGEFH